jgi:hypothetical protein
MGMGNGMSGIEWLHGYVTQQWEMGRELGSSSTPTPHTRGIFDAVQHGKEQRFCLPLFYG